jgi:hypothetical protein
LTTYLRGHGSGDEGNTSAAGFALSDALFLGCLAMARSHSPVNSYPTVDESFARLHRAGWSVGDARILIAEGPAWLVRGSKGENAVSVRRRLVVEADPRPGATGALLLTLPPVCSAWHNPIPHRWPCPPGRAG